MNTTLRNRLAASLLAASAAIGVAGITAGTAHAGPVDHDDVHIAVHLGKADFGTGAHVFGGPVGPGKLHWSEAAGKRTATLRGTVYWDDLQAGGYARVRLILLDSSGKYISSHASDAVGRAGDPGSGGVPAKDVDLHRTSNRATFARIVTESAPTPNGPWTFVGSKKVRYGDVGGQ